MKNNLMKTAALLAALVGAAVCPAQQMVCNYRAAAKTDKTVVGAANFAVKARGEAQKTPALKLVAVERAERQVVAGTNYRLCLSVKSGSANAQATAVVYQNLQNQFELSEWTNGNCAANAQKSNGAGQKNTPIAAIAPDVVVKNLYAAQKGENGPFFQAKSRALVDKFFTKEFADVIWQDAVEANGEVGALGFDPLYNAQDTQITLFKIGKPEYGEGNMDLADVPVTFKNMGKSETILFRLERDARKTWKISDIYYPNADSEATDSLRKIYKTSAELSSEEVRSGELITSKTESVILYVGEESGDYAAYCFKNNSDAGRQILAKCKNGDECEVSGAMEYGAECKVPGLEAGLSASASITKVNSVKSLGRRKK